MNFKQYLAELNTEMGQTIKVIDSTSITDPQVREKINQNLNHELTDLILSPESGVQKIRKAVSYTHLTLPTSDLV